VPIEITSKLLLLCEGKADAACFSRLIAKRPDVPKYDVICAEGSTSFHKLLRALPGDRHGFLYLSGLLITADSTDQPNTVLQVIRNQLLDVGGYPVPQALSEIASKTERHPAVCITLLPEDHRPGALESICVDDLLSRYPWAEECVTQYLKCDQIQAHKWSSEKLAKAKYHCLVAAVNEQDPSRALSMAFKEDDEVIDVTTTFFDSISERLKNFANALGVF
jgi:hypothetical protein